MFCEEFFAGQHLVVVDVVAADSLAGDELGDVVAVVVEEDRHGGEQGGADNNPNLATIRNTTQICNIGVKELRLKTQMELLDKVCLTHDAENEGSGSCGEAETAGAEDRHPPPEQGSLNITMYSILSHKIIQCPYVLYMNIRVGGLL